MKNPSFIKSCSRIGILVSLMLCPFLTKATFIVPPEDIGEFVHLSDYIVYGKVLAHHQGNEYLNTFQIQEIVKGDLQQGELILLKEYGNKMENMIQVVAGDVDFKVGQEYLLFLFKDDFGHFKTNLFALSVFEKAVINGQELFAHTPELLKLTFIGDVNPNFTGAYSKNDFIPHLQQIALNKTTWNINQAGYINDVFAKTPIEHVPSTTEDRIACPNVRPNHCTTLFTGTNAPTTSCTTNTPAKYENNTWTVSIASGAQTDPSNINFVTDLQNAITTMDNMPGINITYAGVNNCPINSPCNVGSVANSCGGGTNQLWVFFNDPCNQIANLSGCQGTFGLGGHFAFNSCHTDPCGNNWRTALTPFFVMNNGTGCTSAYSYTAVLVHEMLHALGLGHVGSGQDCTSIMNPLTCNANVSNNAPNFGITSLDEQCTEWIYNVGGTTSGNDNETCIPNRTITDNTAAGTYRANQTIITSGVVEVTGTASFEAGTSVKLTPNFHAKSGSSLSITIENCAALHGESTPMTDQKLTTEATTSFSSDLNKTHAPFQNNTHLSIMPNPLVHETAFSFILPNAGEVALTLYNLNGQEVDQVIPKQWMMEGQHDIVYTASDLKEGVFHLVLTTKSQVVSKKMIIVR